MSVEQAAAYVSLSVSWMNKARVLGGGPIYIKAGGKILYDADDLDKWLQARKRTSTSDTGKAEK